MGKYIKPFLSKNKGENISLSKERELLLGEKEKVILFRKYYDVVENIRAAYMNGMPFIPFYDWLVCFEVPTFIKTFDEDYLQLIEMLKASLKNLADSYSYTMEDEHGYLLFH